MGRLEHPMRPGFHLAAGQIVSNQIPRNKLMPSFVFRQPSQCAKTHPIAPLGGGGAGGMGILLFMGWSRSSIEPWWVRKWVSFSNVVRRAATRAPTSRPDHRTIVLASEHHGRRATDAQTLPALAQRFGDEIGNRGVVVHAVAPQCGQIGRCAPAPRLPVSHNKARAHSTSPRSLKRKRNTGPRSASSGRTHITKSFSSI